MYLYVGGRVVDSAVNVGIEKVFFVGKCCINGEIYRLSMVLLENRFTFCCVVNNKFSLHCGRRCVHYGTRMLE